MSSRIVLEALALVTWWGMGRVIRGLQREGRQLSHPSSSSLASSNGASVSRAESNDPVRSS